MSAARRSLHARSWPPALVAGAAGLALGAVLARGWLADASPPRAGGAAPLTHDAGADVADAVATLRAELERAQFAAPDLDGDGLAPAAQRAQHRATAERVLELTDEWRRLAPDDPGLVRWLDRRWSLLVHMLERSDDVLVETSRVRETSAPELRRAALLARAEAAAHMRVLASEARVEAAAAAEAAGCDPTRVALVWCRLASHVASSADEQRRWIARAAGMGADSRHVAHPLERLRARCDQVGRLIQLRFADVRNGETIDVADCAGRPVLLLAWSGDSDDVHAAIACARQLARELGPQGLTVLGLHEWRIDGGEAALRARLVELDFDVPHLYEEAETPWEGRVRGLGVREVPSAILLDREGRVALTSARVEALAPLARALRTGARASTSPAR
jgi:hypothetical protein